MRNIKYLKLQEDEIMMIAKASDALAHPARIKIFRYIMQCNKNRVHVCNKDVTEAMPYCQSTCSQHINKLIESGLINARNEEKFVFYYVNLGMLQKFLNATKKLGIEAQGGENNV